MSLPAKVLQMSSVPKTEKDSSIQGGFFIVARKIEDSEIAHAAPVIRELWYWLIRQVNYLDNEAVGLKRGQCVRRIADMQDGLHWFVGYRKETYTKTQCEGALEWLRKHHMITTAKTTRGLVITLCKYESYQNPKNYEGNSEGNKNTTRTQQPPSTIIEESKEREEYTTTTDAPAVAPEKVDMVDENISNISDKPASKPKKKEKKVSAYEGFTDDQIILYQSAMAWIAEKAPRVLKMPEPLTIKQYFRLIEEYDAGIIEDCFQSMHNWKPLLTKSVSALLTFYTFAKNRQQKLL